MTNQLQRNQQQYKKMLYKLLRIRMIEEEIARRYPQGKMRCPIHLSIGQEAVAVMIGEQLRPTDLMVGTHRGHAHYLAKGGDLKRLIAELYGRITGATQGRGGSMNLSDLQAGFVASTAIVGNTVPIGVGLAFAQQLKKEAAVTCVLLGDAAVEEGVVYESLNFAILRKLPVIFVCENNLYSVNTPFHLRQPANRKIHEMVQAMGAKTKHLDGNDTLASFSAVGEVMQDLRQQGGVWFLEFATYRYKIHCGPEDDVGLDRPKEEFDYWYARDPVFLLQNQLMEANCIKMEDVTQWRGEIQDEINQAFDFAEQSAFPPAEDRFLHKYADTRATWLEKTLNGLKAEALID